MEKQPHGAWSVSQIGWRRDRKVCIVGVLNPVVESRWGMILIDGRRHVTYYHYHHYESEEDGSKYDYKETEILCYSRLRLAIRPNAHKIANL